MRRLLFCLDPERAHNLAIYLLRARFAPLMPLLHDPKKYQQPLEVFGLQFPNPVGLAAGWDKNAVCFDALFRLGFGFVEVGGVTPKPQTGNPKPRLFRIPKKKALINRMGFANAGLDALVSHLQTRKEPGILGVNIVKNRDTPLSHALDDYTLCLKGVFPFVDYITVNISSPNTPGLRELQSDHYLRDLLQGLRTVKKNMSAMYHRDVPLLVKTSVDLPETEYARFVQTIIDFDIDGLIISNTTVDHTAVANDKYGNEAGGLSGKPLLEKTAQMIRAISNLSEKKLPIIGCGGILSGKDAMMLKDSGASLFQIMTGFVYRGPALIKEILRAIAAKQ
ncbi:MAG TPA: quinone-dependent dihydroorotate dehydrogenase [Coxiellaceae bacterium]|nr:quinone-dependent dihydroorotate dehydrogenase [Coxiellaceae bacterium]